METKKPNRKKSKRLTVDVTPKFHQDILNEISITDESISAYVTRVIRENLGKRDS